MQNIKLIVVLFTLFMINVAGQAQSITDKNFLDPDVFLVGDKALPKVLLVGTFHFGYPNLDEHKTEEEDQVNIFSAKKQKELKVLLDYLAKFKPTKIVVEAGVNSGYLMRRYEGWEAGTRQLGAQEVEQIGFRLMKRFELDTIYGCDAPGLTRKMSNSKDSAAFRPFLEETFAGYDWRSDDPIDAKYNDYYDYDDKLSARTHLFDYFKYMNSDKVLRRSHGAYLIGDFKLDNERGADALSLYWYSRNLNIFRHIQKVGATSEDRVLVLFGAGHIPILKHLFESSPEFEVVPFGGLEIETQRHGDTKH